LDVLLFFGCADAGLGVDATVRPSPLKFLSDGVPQQLPMVDEYTSIGLTDYASSYVRCGGVVQVAAQGLE